MADKYPTITNVSSSRGAPMGRDAWDGEPADKSVRVFHIPFVDGDYDPGGAYWGGGTPLYCATDGENYRRFTRAKNRLQAIFNMGVPEAKLKRGINRKVVTVSDLPTMTICYLTAILFTETDDKDEPLDKRYWAGSFAKVSYLAANDDCLRFAAEQESLLTPENYTGKRTWEEQAGEDFWLSRSGHEGFSSDHWTADVAEQLHAAAKAFKEVYPYVGDDKRIYF